MLDLTRIHPEDYNFAWKIAKDAIDDFAHQDDTAVEELMQDPKKLEDIDIDMFADLLEKRMKEKKKDILFMILRMSSIIPFMNAVNRILICHLILSLIV